MSRSRTITAVTLLLGTLACGGDGTGPGPVGRPGAMVAISGDGQSATVGAALPAELVVEVRDENGARMSGVEVAWTTASGSLSSARTNTGSDGRATVTWTLGETAGAVEATARVGTLTPVVFDATALPGAAVELTISPDSLVFTSLGATLVATAEVRDAFDNVLESPAVTWSSSDEAIVTINASTGSALSHAAGSTEITATVGSASASIDVHVRPELGGTAATDVYPHTVTGNVRVASSRSTTWKSVLANDTWTGTVTLTYEPQSRRGGAVTMVTAAGASQGTFTYDPPPGYEGADTIDYTITTDNGSADGVVVLNVAGMIWFVNGNLSVGGDGRLTRPFESLETLLLTGAAGPGDAVFIYETADEYQIVSPLVLDEGQILIGQDASGSIGALAGLTIGPTSDPLPAMNATAGRHVIIRRLNPGNVVTLANDNALYGLRLHQVAGGAAVAGTDFGTLTARNVAITDAHTAFDLSNGTVDVVLDSLRTNGGGALDLNGVNGAITTGTGSMRTSSTAPIVNVVGGNVDLSIATTVTDSAALPVLSVSGGHTGDLTFSGNVLANGGTGLQFDNADGSYTFTGIVELGGDDAGVDIVNGSSGTFVFGTGTAIRNPLNDAFVVVNSAPAVQYSGTIWNNVIPSRPVRIEGMTGGTITFDGDTISTAFATTENHRGILVRNGTGGTIEFAPRQIIVATGDSAGITLANNTGMNVTFAADSMQIVTTGGRGFAATGGGTVTVANGYATIETDGGTALTLENVALGVNGITLYRLSQDGGVNAVVLTNTTGGSLLVTGDGATPGSGGIVQNTSGPALLLTGSNVSHSFPYTTGLP